MLNNYIIFFRFSHENGNIGSENYKLLFLFDFYVVRIRNITKNANLCIQMDKSAGKIINYCFCMIFM